MRRMLALGALIGVALLAASCFSFTPPDPRLPCGEGYCESGEICVDAQCFRVCERHTDCNANEACLERTCRTYAVTCSRSGDECVDGYFCQDEVCVRQLGVGEPCVDNDGACLSGFCREGLCCASACDGTCVSCRATETRGTDGDCASIIAGTDPANECDGVVACDGTGACWALGLGDACDAAHQCTSGLCVDGVCCDDACAGPCRACSAALSGGTDGLCTPLPDGTDDQEECAGPLACNGEGACWGKTTGDACDAGYQCANGLCVDGSCCASECDQPCQRCDATGACGSVTGLDDPDTCGAATTGGECPTAPCSCDAGGVCRPSTAVPCSSGGTCLSGVCRGGTCCDGACAGPCTSCNSSDTGHPNGECWPATNGKDPENECSGVIACDGAGACHDTPQGTACANDFECATGVCDDRDLVCCNVECTGTCRACHGNQTEAAAGTCADIVDHADPDNECLATRTHLTCNGAAACYDKVPGAACSAGSECRTNDCCSDVCRWGWSVQYDSPNNLLAIWVTSGSSVIAVGLNGAVVEYDGSNWSESALIPTGLTYPVPLIDVHGTIDTYAIISADDDIWTRASTGSWVWDNHGNGDVHYAAVWMENTSRAWVPAREASIARVYYYAIPTATTYICPDCTPRRDTSTSQDVIMTAATGNGQTLYTGGYSPATPPFDGTVYSYTQLDYPNNGTWTNLAFPYGKPNDIQFVPQFMTSPDRLYVAFENSTGNGIARYDLSAGTWSEVSPAPPVAPKAQQWFPLGSPSAMVVGGNTNVYLYRYFINSWSWVTQPTSATGALNDLHGPNVCDMFAVSQNGEVLRR